MLQTPRQYALCLAMLWYVLVSVWIHLASEKRPESSIVVRSIWFSVVGNASHWHCKSTSFILKSQNRSPKNKCSTLIFYFITNTKKTSNFEPSSPESSPNPSSQAKAQGDDGRRRLLGSQAMVVAGAGHGAADHLVVLSQAIGQAGDGCDIELGTILELERTGWNGGDLL